MAAKLIVIEGGWRIEGDINYRTVVALRREGERCLNNSNPGCRFDLSTVNQVNTAALALLLSWRRKARQVGIDLKYVNVPPELMAIARMSDLVSLFE